MELDPVNSLFFDHCYVTALAQRRNAARTARALTQGTLTLRPNRTPPTLGSRSTN